ncbi:hypothetical protein HanRHA438_Chr03g0110631 [Helianthus annuus]|uniref:Uncharacterized protein n=1 Tax=Helianthus annuus TaxID=4232 RepID=A0A9K3JEM4_HELAN|nr:hypothetical protein HanXRQr2_Chr03g0099621 [Helianthus annuus]KAJ0592264.1 hypothetical protein HanHA300_Chr03g0082921 [Helianthus annuus]KAJ0599763.1 hypothetical protein HanIR_Chr03g0108671 [Helianthus annuus]KAJ0607250.1 hypothetical protein HanHA89_Chr03g0094421 [Helianthus annuus]KAJ0767309.1 hypothetical protein HanLR1_Chr03g0087711 [Helianthus annuus]
MEFCDPTRIPKEDLKIPRGAGWYEKLLALPKQTFGEQVLVATGMNDRWPRTNTNVPMLLLRRRLPSITGRSMQTLVLWACGPCAGVRSSGTSKIRCNFMYPSTEFFVAPKTMTEGACIPNPRPCRAITPAGEEVVLISNEESIASSEHELKSPLNVFAGSLREVSVDHKDEKPNRVSKKKVVTIAEGARPKKLEATGAASDAASHKGTAHPQQRNLDDFVYVADSLAELHSLGAKAKTGRAAVARSSGSVSAKDQPSSATPTSTPAEEEVDIDPVPT